MVSQVQPIRTAFVMEQTLGHVTHFRNLQRSVAEQQRIAATWLPIAFDELRGPPRLLPGVARTWSVRASWRARRALDRELSGHQLDAVVFHTQVTSLFSRAIMRRIPSIISLDATPINYDSVGEKYGHRPAGAGPLDRQKYRLNRYAFHAAARLVCWSDWARASLVHDYGVAPDKIHVIAPGADRAYFEIGHRRALGSSTGVSSAPVKLLFVGGDFQRKGGRHLLEAFSGTLAERCELDLVTGSDVPSGPNVRVHRHISPNSPELQRLYAAADVFVLPTMAECLAVVLMEATAAGLPVVTTSVGALREAVLPDRSGLLIEPSNPAALHRALVRLVESAELRRSMGRAGHQLAGQKFDARRNNHRLLKLVEEQAVAQRAPGRARVAA
jgi:glycosyltransferase involved in cell wall biosynthesis